MTGFSRTVHGTPAQEAGLQQRLCDRGAGWGVLRTRTRASQAHHFVSAAPPLTNLDFSRGRVGDVTPNDRGKT